MIVSVVIGRLPWIYILIRIIASSYSSHTSLVAKTSKPSLPSEPPRSSKLVLQILSKPLLNLCEIAVTRRYGRYKFLLLHKLMPSRVDFLNRNSIPLTKLEHVNVEFFKSWDRCQSQNDLVVYILLKSNRVV
jgi:hypothetical protein